MRCQSTHPQARSRRGLFPGHLALTGLGVVVTLAAVPAPSLGGEKPPKYCDVGGYSNDIQTTYVTNISYAEYYGGNDCKPMVIAGVYVQRLGTIPEQCSTASAGVEGRVFRLRVNGVPQRDKTTTSVPWIAHIRGETSGGYGSVRIAWPNSDQTASFNSGGSPSFYATLSGVLDVSANASGTDGSKSIANGTVQLTAFTEATVCNYDPVMTKRASEVITDPYVEIDPTWPEAANWKIEKETQPNSGVWVELKRDSTAVQFTDVTTPALANSGHTTLGIAWGDYDGDGDLDLYTDAYGSGNNRLFRNDAGVLIDVTPPELALPSASNVDVSWADVDNDGDLDLFLTRGLPTLHNVLKRNDGPAGFVEQVGSALEVSGYGRNAAWADYDNDGDLDVYLPLCGQGNRLYRNDGNGVFSNVTTPLLANNGSAQSAYWGDYDNDGWMDLALLNNSGSTQGMLFHNNGGVFTDATGPSGLNVVREVTAMYGSWVDYDDDGWLDFYASMNGANRLFHNNSDGTFTDSTDVWTGYEGWGMGTAWGDVELDGDLDAYLTKLNRPSRVAVRFDGHFGTSMFHVGGPVAGPVGGQSVGWADYDDDGDLDLYVGYGDQAKLLRNDQALGNRWLQVDLRGIQSNRFGVGARIRVVAGGRNSHRQVLNNGGMNGNPLRATFGLGAAAVIDTIEVRWPSGVVTTLPGPFPANQRMEIAEDGTVSGVESPALARALPTILGCSPNPFGPATAIRFSLPRPEAVGLTLFDVGGRLVREIRSPGALPAGISSLGWDGLDEQGHRLTNGVYFCRLRAGSFESDRSMVLKITKVE
jgi:enediyne biosynthesis protein E4